MIDYLSDELLSSAIISYFTETNKFLKAKDFKYYEENIIDIELLQKTIFNDFLNKVKNSSKFKKSLLKFCKELSIEIKELAKDFAEHRE